MEFVRRFVARRNDILEKLVKLLSADRGSATVSGEGCSIPVAPVRENA